MTSSNFKITDEQLEEMIKLYGRDLTALARQDRFDPITGRDKEIDEAILILMQRGRKNVMLLAPAGVGKTALCIGLAQTIIRENVPEYLKNARLIELDMASMAAGTNSSAEFQGRFIPMVKGFAERFHDPSYPRTILFIDEVHTIMPTVKGSAYRGLSEVLKPYLTVGDILTIGATTRDEYREYVAKDPALDRRFQKIFLKVPTTEETYTILQNLKPSYEKHFSITIGDEELKRITELTAEHMPNRNQPDKSIITLDAACAYQVIHNGKDTELSFDAVNKMVARETGLHEAAIADDKQE